MKVAIVGSRSITDVEYVFTQIDRFIKDQCPTKPVLISGGAKGIDSLTKDYAKAKGYDFIEYVPYFQLDTLVKFSPRHFFIRNKQIVYNADKVLAIWDGQSKGTEHAISYAQKIGVPVMVIKSHHPVCDVTD